MEHFDRFIDEKQSEGKVHSQGTFTVDFEQAIQKLAKFQLKTPEEFIIRLAQAANLGAQSFDFKPGEQHTVTLHGWNPAYSLEKIASSITNPSFSGKEGALDYLRIGLTTIYHTSSDGVDIIQRIAGKTGSHRLQFRSGFTISVEDTQTANKESSLEIIWKDSSKKSKRTSSTNKLILLLSQSSILSKVPVTKEKMYLAPPRFRNTKKPQDIDRVVHKELCWHYIRTEGQALPPALNVLEKDYTYSLNVTTHPPRTRNVLFRLAAVPNKEMTVHFIKAGMVVATKKRVSKLGGLTVYMDVNELKTDLTGSQFRDPQELDRLMSWAERSSKILIDPAVEVLEGLKNKGKSKAVLPATGCALLIWTSMWLTPTFFDVYYAFKTGGPYNIDQQFLFYFAVVTPFFLAISYTALNQGSRSSCEDCENLIDELESYRS